MENDFSYLYRDYTITLNDGTSRTVSAQNSFHALAILGESAESVADLGEQHREDLKKLEVEREADENRQLAIRQALAEFENYPAYALAKKILGRG